MSKCEFESTKIGHCYCGKKLTGRQKRYCSPAHRKAVTDNHRWTQARQLARKRAAWFKCERCGTFVQDPEVNHIVPCKGKHGVWGCWHHQSNLEVLCTSCHSDETKRQREAGELK